jgi:hypothetical protein
MKGLIGFEHLSDTLDDFAGGALALCWEILAFKASNDGKSSHPSPDGEGPGVRCTSVQKDCSISYKNAGFFES